MPDRETIILTIRSALEPREDVLALWEAGAAAFDRVDIWSDIDLVLVVDDTSSEDWFHLIEETLQRLAPIELKYILPQPTWHGHAQAFYRLADTSIYSMIDLVIMSASATNRFLEREVHGEPRVYFDKNGQAAPTFLDWETHWHTLRERLNHVLTIFELFQPLTLKELNRHNAIEAMAFYQAYTLRPLVEALRIRYCPQRYQFNTRYVHYDLPENVLEKLVNLYYVQDENQLRESHTEAVDWFHDTVKSLQDEPHMRNQAHRDSE